MADAQLKADSSRTTGVLSPAQRTRIEAISASADAATLAAHALDLESDNVPEQLKCPICQDVPLGEVIQCMNGHSICLKCQLKSGKPEGCTQCRTAMKNLNGGWIRNRMMEGLLDSILFTCPFRKDGCPQVLSRAKVSSHKKGCCFGPDRVQICKYFKFGDHCDFWTCTHNLQEALDHLNEEYQFDGLYDNNDKFWFDFGEELTPFDLVEGLVTRQNGATYLTIAWSDKQTDNISFACIRLDKAPLGEVEVSEVELTLERQHPLPVVKIPNWKLTLPVVSLTEAPKTVLQQKPAIVPRLFLRRWALSKSHVKEVDCDKVRVTVLVSISSNLPTTQNFLTIPYMFCKQSV